jgi:hypothetical protein
MNIYLDGFKGNPSALLMDKLNVHMKRDIKILTGINFAYFLKQVEMK